MLLPQKENLLYIFGTGENCSEDIKECASLPCQHGGTCSEPHSGSYHCSCPMGMSGIDCDFVSLATFNGESSLNVLPTVIPTTQMNMFSFKISFMTSVPSGIVFVIQQVIKFYNVLINQFLISMLNECLSKLMHSCLIQT